MSIVIEPGPGTQQQTESTVLRLMKSQADILATMRDSLEVRISQGEITDLAGARHFVATWVDATQELAYGTKLEGR